MARLLAAPPWVLATLARGFAAAGQDRHPRGSAALGTRPAAVQVLDQRRYRAGIPPHRPLFSGCAGVQ